MAYSKKGHWEVLRVRVRGATCRRWWGRVSKETAMTFPPDQRRFHFNCSAYTDETMTVRKQ